MLTVYVIEIKDSRLKHITTHNHLKQILLLSALPESLLKKTKRTCCGKLTAGDYYINISYADNYAFVMITKQKYGIDAEKIKPKSNHMKTLLSSVLSTSLLSDYDFFKAWTAMEAEVKYYGDKGLFDALQGNLKKDSTLQTIHFMYKENIIAITSTKNNLKNQEVLFKKMPR